MRKNLQYFSAMLLVMLVLQACTKPQPTPNDKIASAKEYAKCSVFYEVLSKNFNNSVQKGISDVGGVMDVVSKALASDVYGKENGLIFVENEKRVQTPLIQEIFDQKRDVEAKVMSDRCKEMGERVIKAIDKRK